MTTTATQRADLSEIFETQAYHCRGLGSPFTADLCLLFAKHLDEETAVGRHVLHWPGRASYRADAVPLRLCGALHALTLTDQSPNLKAHYPDLSQDEQTIARIKVPDWSVIHTALVEHETFILDWMTSPPQTNEVRRANGIWPILQTVATLSNLPMDLWEIGCSGGLNLRLGHFCYRHDGMVSGEPDSAVALEPEWRGAPPPTAVPEIDALKGCDLNPLDPSTPGDRLRLLAYLWADQKHRVERTSAAIDIALVNPAEIAREDAIAWLKQQLPDRRDDRVTVIYTTIAWQYLPDAAKAEGEALIEAAGRNTKAPLAFIQMEGDGQSPGAALSLKYWPDAIDTIVGRVDFHGRWVDWQGLR